MNKKRVILGLSLILVLIFSFSFSLGQAEPEQATRDLVTTITSSGSTILSVFTPIAEALVGSTPGDEYILQKFLFLVIIFGILYNVFESVEFFNRNEYLIWSLSIAVSILSVRYLLLKAVIETVLLPYSTLGIFLAVIIPFIAAFYFIEKAFTEYPTVRKVSWILLAVIFTFLWSSRYAEIAALASGMGFNPAWIYLFTAIGCIVMFTLDKTIQNAFAKAKYQNVYDLAKADVRSQLMKDIDNYRSDITNNVIDTQKESQVRYNRLERKAKSAGLSTWLKGILSEPIEI